MHPYPFAGEGSLEEPATENNLLKDYADKKAFTGCLCLLFAIALVGFITLCGVAYSFLWLIMNIIDVITK
jgi:hypothetical protein